MSAVEREPLKVLVTGPTQNLEDYAAAATASGWDALTWPLLAITATEVDLVELIDGLPDWICLTSANALPALEHAAQQMPELLTARFSCVGERSERSAHKAGFRSALPPAEDAESMASALVEVLEARSQVLWPRGSLARGLGESLEAAGHSVLDPIVYETRPGEALPPQGSAAADAVFLTSPSAVRTYLERRSGADRPAGAAMAAVAAIAAIAIGPTTARALAEHPEHFAPILSLEHPTPEAFAALLAQIEGQLNEHD